MVPLKYSLCGVLFLFLAHGSSAHICDICDCQPDQNEVFSITCDCQATRDLHLTSSMMMGVEATSMVIIRNCQIVSVEKNSFSQLLNLDTLGIMNCMRLYLATGAFSSLNSLLINNVQDISFGEMALMGARGVKNIIINSSNITELPKFSLFDVEGMDRFSMNSVNIGRVNRHAFNVTAKTIGIENTKINYIEPNGFSLQAQKVMIKKSDFLLVEPNAMSIQTEFHTRLLENNFGGFFRANITSPFAEFFGNRFENLDSSVFAPIQMPRLLNNFIFGTDFELFRNFSHKDFHDNQFVCRCGMNLLNYTKNSHNYEILKKNYCMTNCSLSLFEFEVESIAGCIKNHQVDATSYCNYGRTFKSDPRIGNSGRSDALEGYNNTVGKIQPRFLDVDDDEPSGSVNLIAQWFAIILAVIATFVATYRH